MSNDVEPLLREREGYVRRNLPGRIAQVDEQLRALGYEVEAATAEPEETAAFKPRKRTAKRAATSDD